MSYPLVIRLMIGMALMPDASYCEALARLAGVLADIPFALEWHVPTEKVVTGWRRPVPADVMGGPVPPVRRTRQIVPLTNAAIPDFAIESTQNGISENRTLAATDGR
jgi:hypothetical protein